MRALLLAALLALLGAAAEDNNARIGVLESQPLVQLALEAATRAADDDDKPLLSEPGEPLSAPRLLCEAASEGVDAMITGAQGDATLAAAVAARVGVPLLLVGEQRGAGASWEALEMYPRAALKLAAARDVARDKGWTRAALLHEGSAAAAAVLAPDPDPLELLVRQLPPRDDNAMLRDVLLVLKKAGLVNFIVLSEEATAVRVLDAAQRVGLLADKHSYIMLALELHTRSLYNYSHGGANITAFMMFEPESETTLNVTESWRAAYNTFLDRKGWEEGEKETVGQPQEGQEGFQLNVEMDKQASALLLAADAVAAVTRARLALQLLYVTPPQPDACECGVGAFHADTLLNYIRSEDDEGATGLLSWDAEGARRGVQLVVTELQRGGRLERAGSWSELDGVQWQRKEVPVPPLPSDSMTNRTFNILIALMPPYIMRRESIEQLSGNARYEGFCIELIERLAEILNFNYTFIQAEGSYDAMLDKIITNDNYHFAITDLTITEDREKRVDFTTPFMNLGISILFHRPKPPEPELFAFLLPFSTEVWLYLGLAYIGTSLVLYVVGRLCPEEWQNPYPCIEEPPALENQFTLGNALWFNLGAVLLQGSEIAPVAYGSRAVAGVWWVFALVITSSYTANLATLLAKETTTEVIKNVRELAENDKGITYGAKFGGSTYTFFQSSQNELYKKMFAKMIEQPMPKDNNAGIEMASREEANYAFLMESTTIEYVVERNCLVYMVGDLLDNKGYGIAMRKMSPYRQELNLALLRLQETGVLREMKHVWWNERHGGGACKEKDSKESSKLVMANFKGLFLVLLVGCSLGVVVSCCDLAWQSWRRPRDPDRPFRYNFLQELRFVFRFDQSAKPLQGPLIESKTTSPRTSERSSERGGEGGEGGECGEEGEERADSDGGDADADVRARSESALGARRRRRSSMHNASVRLARHAHNN